VQALEDQEDPLVVLQLDPYAVVADRETPEPILALSGDADLRRPLGPELDRVGEQVLQDVRELGGVGPCAKRKPGPKTGL